MTLIKSRPRFALVIHNLAIFIASLIVSFVLGEAILRIFLPDKYYVWQPGLRREFVLEEGAMPGIGGKSVFSVNKSGIRGSDFSKDHTFRILTLGGSTTECLYLDDAEAWPSLLETYLNKMNPGGRIWVGNIGQSGFRSPHHIMHVKYLLRQYPKIDMLIIMVGVNDFLGRLIKGDDYLLSKPFEQKTPAEVRSGIEWSFRVYPETCDDCPLYRKTMIWRALSRLFDKIWKKPPSGFTQDNAGKVYLRLRNFRKGTVAFISSLPDLSDALKEYEQNIKTLIRLAGRQNVRVVFVTQAVMWRQGLTAELTDLLWAGGIGDYFHESGRAYYSPEVLETGMNMYNETLLRVCRGKNVKVIDISQLFAKDTTTFYDDFHFNESGAEKVARALADYLVEEGLQGTVGR